MTYDNLTRVHKQLGDVCIGYVDGLRGADTQGRTLKELRENLDEATELVVASKK